MHNVNQVDNKPGAVKPCHQQLNTGYHIRHAVLAGLGILEAPLTGRLQKSENVSGELGRFFADVEQNISNFACMSLSINLESISSVIITRDGIAQLCILTDLPSTL